MKHIKKIFWAISFLFINACNSEKPESGMITIDIEKCLGKPFSSIYMSEIFSDITYIPLQTNNDIIIGKSPEITVVDEMIIVNDIDNCYLFNKNDGKFIRKIGAKGKGPNEFFMAKGGFLNPIKRRIYLLGWDKNLLEFDFEGKFEREISMPKIDSVSNRTLATNCTFFDNDIIAYISNSTGKENKLLMVFTTDSKIISVHNNTNIFPDKSSSFSLGESQFYHYKNQMFFKELYNDTIYRVTNEHLFPHMVLHTGEYLLPYESKWWKLPVDFGKFVFPYNFIEIDSNFLFTFYYNYRPVYVCFDKITGSIKISDSDSGVVNDIHNFIPFIPSKAINKYDIMGYTDAWKIEQWFKDNPNKAYQLPPHIKKLESLTENDNPVVMIARLK